MFFCYFMYVLKIYLWDIFKVDLVFLCDIIINIFFWFIFVFDIFKILKKILIDMCLFL